MTAKENSLQVVPDAVIFRDVNIGDVDIVDVWVKNVGKKSVSIRFSLPFSNDSPFSIQLNKRASTVPGLATKNSITYKCKDLKINKTTLTIQCEDTILKIPVIAYPPAPQFHSDITTINVGSLPIFSTFTKSFNITNSGVLEGQFKITATNSDGVQIVPTTGVLHSNETLPCSFLFKPEHPGPVDFTIQINVNNNLETIPPIHVIGEGVDQSIIVQRDGKTIQELQFGHIFFGQKRVLEAQIVNRGPSKRSFVFLQKSQRDDLGPDIPQIQNQDTTFSAVPNEGELGPYCSMDVSMIFAPKKGKMIGEGEDLTFAQLFNLQVVETGQVSDFVMNGYGSFLDFKLSAVDFLFSPQKVNTKTSQYLEISNLSKHISLSFEMKSVAGFRFIPENGTIGPSKTSKIQICFYPRNLGDFASEATLSINQGLTKRRINVSGKAVADISKVDQKFHRQQIWEIDETAKYLVNHPESKYAMSIEDIDKKTKTREVFDRYISDAEKEREAKKEKAEMLKKLRGQAIAFYKSTSSKYTEEDIEYYIQQKMKESVDPDDDVDAGFSLMEGLEPPHTPFVKGEVPLVVPDPNSIGLIYSQSRPSTAKSVKSRSASKTDQVIRNARRFKSKPTTPPEINECARALTPTQQLMVRASPQIMNFGQVSVYSQEKRQFTISNDLDQHILVEFNYEFPELSLSTPASQVVPPMQTAYFDIIFSSDQKTNFLKPLHYTINHVHQFTLSLSAQVIPIEVKLSHQTLEFIFPFDYSQPFIKEYVQIQNVSNAEVIFRWEGFHTMFSIDHNEGKIEPKSTYTSEITYEPGIVSHSEQNVTLYVRGGPAKKLTLIGDAGKPKIILSKKVVNFGLIPIGVTKTSILKLRNAGNDDGIITISHAKSDIINVTPKNARVSSNEIVPLQITLICPSPQSFNIPVLISICGANSIQFTVTGEAELPKVELKYLNLEFGKTFIGNSDSREITLINTSSIPAILFLDLSNHPEFHIQYSSSLSNVGNDHHSSISVVSKSGIAVSSALTQSQLMALEEMSMTSLKLSTTNQNILENNNENNENENIPLKKLSNEETQKGNIYKLVVIENSSVTFNLIFQPEIAGEYSFELPLTLMQLISSSFHIQPIVSGEALHAPILPSASIIDFGVCTIFVPQNPNSRPIVRELALKNGSNAVVEYRFDTSVSDVFFIDHPEGTIPYSSVKTLYCSFKPKAALPYNHFLPLYVNIDGKDMLIAKIQMTGVGSSRFYQTTINNVCLPTVPIGVTSSITIDILNSGFIESELKVISAVSEKSFPISVEFPQGNKLFHSTIRIPLQISFCSIKPLSFSTSLALIDNLGHSYSFSVSFQTDNSVFTLLPLFMDTYTIQSGGGKAISATFPQLLSLSSFNRTNSQNLSNFKNDSKLQLISKGSNKNSSRNSPNEKNNSSNNDSSNKNSPSGNNKQKSKENRAGMTRFPNSTNAKTPINIREYLPGVLSVDDILKLDQFKPIVTEEFALFLKRFLNTLFMSTQITSFPADLRESDGSLLLELLTHMTGTHKSSGFSSVTHLLSSSLSKPEQKLAAMKEFLHFLMSIGAHVPFVRPEFLLDESSFLYFMRQKIIRQLLGIDFLNGPSIDSYDQDQLNDFTSTIAFTSNLTPRLNKAQEKFEEISREAWVTVILQLLKLFYINKLEVDGMEKNPLVVSTIDHFKSAIPEEYFSEINRPHRSLLESNIFSSYESALLKWFSIFYSPEHLSSYIDSNKTKTSNNTNTSNNTALSTNIDLNSISNDSVFQNSNLKNSTTFIQNPSQITNKNRVRSRKQIEGNNSIAIVDFNQLRNPLVIASVCKAHVKNIPLKINDPPASHQDSLTNLSQVCNFLKQIKIHFQINPDDIDKGNPVSLALIGAFLYTSLPHYYPLSTIEFKTMLNKSCMQSFTISNPSKHEITYKATLDGSDNFRIPKNNIVLHSSETIDFQIEYLARTHISEVAILQLIPSRPKLTITTPPGEKQPPTPPKSELGSKRNLTASFISAHGSSTALTPPLHLTESNLNSTSNSNTVTIHVNSNNQKNKISKQPSTLSTARGPIPQAPTFASPIVVELNSSVTIGAPMKTFNIQGKIYEPTSLKITIPKNSCSPGKYDVLYTISKIIDENGTVLINKQQQIKQLSDFLRNPIKTIETEDNDQQLQHYLDQHQSFIFSSNYIILPEDVEKGEDIDLTIEFNPIELGTFRCILLFYAGKNEFVYDVIGKSYLPDPVPLTHDLKIEAKQTSEFNIPIEVINNKISQAVAYSLEKTALNAAVVTERKFKELLQYRTREIINAQNQSLAPTDFKVTLSSQFFSTPSTFTIVKTSFANPLSKEKHNTLPLTFAPPKPGEFPLKIMLVSKNDVRIYSLNAIAKPETKNLNLKFSTVCGKEVKQSLPIDNPSEEPWNFKASYNGEGSFAFPPKFTIQPKSSYQFPIEFTPKNMGNYSGSLTITNTTKDAVIIYNIVADVGEVLAEQTIVIKCQAREKHVHHLVIPRFVNSGTIKVSCDVPIIEYNKTFTVEKKSSSFTPDALESLDKKENQKAKPNDTKDKAAHKSKKDQSEQKEQKIQKDNQKDGIDYEFSIFAQRSGIAAGSITFEDTGSHHYIWYVLEVHVDSPNPEDTINVETVAKTSVTVNIPVQNSQDHPITFTASYTDPDFFGVSEFTVQPLSTYNYELIFSPLQESIRNSSITFFNEDEGEYIYHLRLNVKGGETQIVAPMVAILGRYSTTSVKLENPTNKMLYLKVDNDNPMCFEVLGKAMIPIQPHSVKSIDIRYIPCSVGIKEVANICFSAPHIGDWKYSLSGVGKPPQVLSPIIVSTPVDTITSGNLNFENPFPYPTKFMLSLSCDTPKLFNFLTKKRTFILHTYHESFSIPFSFAPHIAGQFQATIVITIVQTNVSVNNSQHKTKAEIIRSSRSIPVQIGHGTGQSHLAAITAQTQYVQTVESSAKSSFNQKLPDLNDIDFEAFDQEIEREHTHPNSRLNTNRNTSSKTEKSPKAVNQVRWQYPLIGNASSVDNSPVASITGEANCEVNEEVKLPLVGESEDFDGSEYRINVTYPNGFDWLSRVLDLRPIKVVYINSTPTLVISAKMNPLRPIHTLLDVIIKNPINQKWEFQFKIDIKAGQPLRTVTIESSLNKSSSCKISVHQMFQQRTIYHAYFAQGSAAEFSVSPSQGFIEPSLSEEVELPFVVSFLPTMYGKVMKGLLIVDTLEHEFIFEFNGQMPPYVPPSFQTGKINTHQSESSKRLAAILSSRRTDYIKANIEAAGLTRPKTAITKPNTGKIITPQ